MNKKVIVFVVSIIGSYAAGAIGSIVTLSNISTWYAFLKKPLFTPPDWVFGPVWSVLYLLMGIALALVILRATKLSKKRAYYWFGSQLVLNAMWAIIFFGLHALWLGVAVITALIISILMTIREFYKIKKESAWPLAPYLAWVCFATYLTVGFALLNG